MVDRISVLAMVTLSALAIAGCSAEVAATEDTSQDDALRTYEDADTEHPEVGILRTEAGYCTGTLIGPRTVLSAAHCFKFGSSIVTSDAPALGTFTIHASGRNITYTFHRERVDANVLQVKFDLSVTQLDVAVSPVTATPATIAEDWPDDGTLTVYGYGRFGNGCTHKNTDMTKRKTNVPPSFPFVRATTCPGDSGGPYFKTGTSEIVATVKGDGVGLEWVADAVHYRKWILKQRDASERGELSIDD
jgi:V8-like Glu-specific endopeptidase